jgi:hypothetical protein
MSKNVVRILLSFWFLAGFSFGFAQNSKPHQKTEILSHCFKTMLETSETGYVLCGQKPLCTIACSEQDFDFLPTEFHRLSISLCVAKPMLQHPFFHTGNILFHFDERDKMLLVVNKKKFLEVVEENLTLFQYVLGPSITSENLLKIISSPEISFFETLKYDRVLIGIVLGYGVQNALYASRYENIFCDLVHVEDFPPFTPYVNLYSNESQKEDLLYDQRNFLSLWGKDRKLLKPSYGYASLQAELNDIEEKMQVSSPKLQQVPNFIFACLKESKTNEALIADLESVQGKIKTLLQSKTLLQDTLALISTDIFAIEEDIIDREKAQIDLHLALAKLFRMGLQEHQSHYLSCFIEGLRGQVDDHEFYKDDILPYPSTLTNICQARNNLEAANSYFQKVNKDRSFSAILEPYLYYSVLEKGQGTSLQGQMDVLVDFAIFDPAGKKLNSAFLERIDLRNVLPAFTHGLQGMRIGERRELLIHPSLAYGVHTLLEKGIYLTAIVTLHHIYDSDRQILPPLLPTDLSYILDKNFYKECEEKYRRFLQLRGQQKREFLKLCPGIQLDLVEKAFESSLSISALTQAESDAINRLLWKVYFDPEKN